MSGDPTQDGSVPVSDVVAPDVDGGPVATNPYGEEYPTANIGWRPRQGATPGDRIANLRFASLAPRKTIELAELYDPEWRAHDVIVLLGVLGWDGLSQALMNGIGAPMSRLRFLAILGAGNTPETPADANALMSWAPQYPWADHGIDDAFALIRPLFPVYEVPLVTVIDARTMEIVHANLAVPDPRADIQQAAAEIRNRPPAY
ncbi:MAG: hypothetical protein KF850_21210 [Labilithrix sp.]|nr:hypothetical protein [Labilithrix sp.]MBX3214569.1 hypothetical protein [Labilithrix sp.]